MDKAHILEEALNAKLLPTSRKIPMLPNADQGKHYYYHHNYGHNIKECVILRDKKMIQEGTYINLFRKTLTKT